MIGNSILDSFDLPQVAVDSIRAQKLKMQMTQDGVQTISTEHQDGLPFRFFVYTEYLPIKSKQARFESFQDVDCIEWTIDSKNKYPARVSELPPELLEFEVIGYREATPNVNPNFQDDPYAHPIFGECIGGKLKDAYDRFKNGLSTPGLMLSKWGVMSDADCASLAKYSVFSVEQFAAMPRAKVFNGNTPKSIQEAFERAVFYVNGKENRIKEKDLADKLMAMAQDKAALEERLAALEARLNPEANQDEEPKRRGRPAKIILNNEEIE